MINISDAGLEGRIGARHRIDQRHRPRRLEEMAAAGAAVVMNGLGDAAEIEGELKRIRGATDVAAVYLPANLMEPKACAEMIAMATARPAKSTSW